MIAPRRAPLYSSGMASQLKSGGRANLLPAEVPLLPSSAGAGNRERTLSTTQIDAIRKTMKLFVDDDLARGVGIPRRVYCDGCERPRPAAGVIHYDRYLLCNGCAVEYEVARARGLVTTTGQYVRDKHFGDGDLYMLHEG